MGAISGKKKQWGGAISGAISAAIKAMGVMFPFLFPWGLLPLGRLETIEVYLVTRSSGDQGGLLGHWVTKGASLVTG